MKSICIIEASENYYLMANEKSGCIASFSSVQKGLALWERAYTKSLDRGAGWHAGAFLARIQFDPRIVEINGVEDIANYVESTEILSLSGESLFNLMCVKLKNTVKEIFEKGHQPMFADSNMIANGLV